MIKIVNPATEVLVREVETDTPSSIAKKFKDALLAQREWALTGLDQRLACLQKFRQFLEKDCEELAKILTTEVGKPLSQSRNEVKGTIGRLDFFLEHTPQVLRSEQVLNDTSNRMEERISHEPLGVIANISAWNYPYFVGSNVFFPALLTGNAVLYKPSEFALLSGIAITERLHRSGIPRDLFALIIGDGNVGAELLKQPVNGVFFTGSYGTGMKIAEATSKKMVKLQLELGGKDPVYVCDDVDPAKVAPGVADGAFYNSGQSCCAVERIYVHTSVYEGFLEHFMKAVGAFVMGDPLDDKTYIGPLTRSAQLDVLEKQVQDAVKKGAKVLCGGKRVSGKKGFYFEPTVLVNVNHTMDVMREESFGPIIGIQRVKDDGEALQLMNDSAYGLTAGVYAQQQARAEKILAQVNVGSAYWNCCDRVSPRLPWSGRGHSGLGLTLGKQGILAFTQVKAWHLRGS